eukprot:scaffold104772_cov16-Prasinocladus_malaysianus.AAC.2
MQLVAKIVIYPISVCHRREPKSLRWLADDASGRLQSDCLRGAEDSRGRDPGRLGARPQVAPHTTGAASCQF